jgi:hypothetical protein
MNVYRPLRAVLFLYELVRFGALISLLTVLGPSFTGSGDDNVFPYLAFTAPNALYPLMTMFLLLRLEEFGAYIPLYAAGKVIGGAVFFIWCGFSYRIFLEAAFFGRMELLIKAGFFFLIFGGDIFSCAGAVALKNRLDRKEIPAAETEDM